MHMTIDGALPTRKPAAPTSDTAQDRTAHDQGTESRDCADDLESRHKRATSSLKARVLAGKPIVITKLLAGDDLENHMRTVDDLIGDLGVPVTVIYTP